MKKQTNNIDTIYINTRTAKVGGRLKEEFMQQIIVSVVLYSFNVLYSQTIVKVKYVYISVEKQVFLTWTDLLGWSKPRLQL